MDIKLNTAQLELLEFVKKQHRGQKRKYTFEPYWAHVLSVAEIVNKYESDCVEIALCHDLFEDTKCNFNSLHKFLVNGAEYNRRRAYDICTCVNELTDVFTHEDYPYLNRSKRKELESDRLGAVSPIAQSVKYADLIDNTKSIVKYDKSFAGVYLYEKLRILSKMKDGNSELFEMCQGQAVDLANGLTYAEK